MHKTFIAALARRARPLVNAILYSTNLRDHLIQQLAALFLVGSKYVADFVANLQQFLERRTEPVV